MKNQISWIRNAGMLLLISPLAIGCLQSVTEPVEQATSVAPTTTETDSVTEATFADSTSATDTDMDEDWSGDEFGFSAFPMENLSDVPVTFVTDELFVPANIHPGPGTIEVIKLADSGVEESVILAYIINSSERFNLGPDEIIYLNDIGIPSALITAMLQRDSAGGTASGSPSSRWSARLR